VGAAPRRAYPRLLLAVVTGLLGALAAAAPAVAHAGDAPAGSNYRSRVTGVTPALPGLRARVVEGGARLELENRTGRPIQVLGYAGEPYLEIRPDGVYENTASPATYLNRTLEGETPPPGADPTAPPSWRRVGTEPVVRWHDQRARWLEDRPPPRVAAAPDRPQRVRDWVIPLRDGTTPLELRGTLDWVPPPDPLLWWSASILGGLVVGALGVLPRDSRPGRRATVALAGLAAVGGGAALGHALGRGADAGLAGMLLGLVTTQLWPTVTGVAALAAAAYALARRPATDFVLTLAGTCLALFTGVTNAAVFARSVVPVPWPAPWARVPVAVALAVGGGLAAAGMLRLHAASRAATAARRSRPRPPSALSGRRRWSAVLPDGERNPGPAPVAPPRRLTGDRRGRPRARLQDGTEPSAMPGEPGRGASGGHAERTPQVGGTRSIRNT